MNQNLGQFNYCSVELEAIYHEAAMKLGLSDSNALILYALYNNNGQCALYDLVSYTGVSKQTMNSALRKLESEGIVGSESLDGRKKTLFLTDAGKVLAEQTVAKIVQIEEEIFHSWPAEECEQFFSLMQKYIDQFRSSTKKLEEQDKIDPERLTF